MRPATTNAKAADTVGHLETVEAATLGTVYIIDDEASVRDSLGGTLRFLGYDTREFASGVDFLDQADLKSPGCVVLDIRMPEITGLAVQQELIERSSPLKIVVMTGHGDVQTAVRAMKDGASDFLEKPFDSEALRRSIDHALRQSAAVVRKDLNNASKKIASLTRREREILHELLKGHTNKQMAKTLSLSPRTIEMHRASLMARLDVNTLSDALAIAFEAGLRRAPDA